MDNSYPINENITREESIISGNVTAANHRDYKVGEVITAWYGDDQSVLHEYIVLEAKTTTDEDNKLVCVVGGLYNINGLDPDSNTVENITKLANRSIYGI